MVNPEAEVCLRTLKALGKHVGVVSNASLPDAVYLAIFKEHGLDAFIDAYSFSHSNRHMKPHESIFLRALEACRCAPGEAVMIGDKYEVDILGARRVGRRSCLYGPSEGGADYRIASFHDFIAQLEEDSRLGRSPRDAP